MSKLHVVSPVIQSQSNSKRFGANVFLKLDNVQPSGSFKIRGISHLAQHAKKSGKTKLVSSSGGNAGMAVAHAGMKLQMETTVIIPESTPKYMQERIESLGATVKVHGKAWDEADKLARELATNPEAQYMPPFEDPLIWEGHASIIQEIVTAKQLDSPPAGVVLCVGGGGLLCGVAEGMRQVGWDNVPIIACETQGASSFAQSIEKGAAITLSSIDSVAKSLGAKRVGDGCLKWAKERPIIPLVVSDKEAVDACVSFADEHRMLVEPACGASLAAVNHSERIRKALNISDEKLASQGLLIIVCGGNMASYPQLLEFAANLE